MRSNVTGQTLGLDYGDYILIMEKDKLICKHTGVWINIHQETQKFQNSV